MKFKAIAIICGVMLISTFGCGSSTQVLEQAAQSSTAEASLSVEDIVATKVAAQMSPQGDTPTENPNPGDSNASSAVQVTDFKELELANTPVFIKDDDHIMTVFYVQNSNSGSAIEGSRYNATLYDEAGTVLSTDSGYLNIVLPGERQPVIVDTYIQDGQKPTRVEITLDSGDPESTEITAPLFVAEQISFLPDEYFPKATALLNNKFSRSFSTILVTAVVYDQSGLIIGGGSTYLNFIASNGQSAVEVPLVVSGTPAAIEIVGQMTSLSMLAGDNSDNESVKLVEYGWSYSDNSVAVGFIVKNSDTEKIIDGTEYLISVMDESGKVLGTSNGYISNVFPNESTGLAETVYLSGPGAPSTVNIQLNPGHPTTSTLTANPFTVENIQFMNDQYFPKVTGIIKNNYADTITTVKLNVLAYDESNQIVGGGYTYVDFVPGNGQMAFEVSVETSKQPSKLAGFVSISSISEIQE